MKSYLFTMLSALTVLVTSGCSTTPLTTSMQPQAVSTALTRARFDMNCPGATGTVLSSEDIQPLIGPGMMMRSGGGIERAAFTIGIRGCDQQKSMVVICSQENGCFAGQGTQSQFQPS